MHHEEYAHHEYDDPWILLRDSTHKFTNLIFKHCQEGKPTPLKRAWKLNKFDRQLGWCPNGRGDKYGDRGGVAVTTGASLCPERYGGMELDVPRIMRLKEAQIDHIPEAGGPMRRDWHRVGNHDSYCWNENGEWTPAKWKLEEIENCGSGQALGMVHPSENWLWIGSAILGLEGSIFRVGISSKAW